MTLDEIEQRLHEAITTLAALPDREQRWLRARQSGWPETLREAGDIMAIAFERVKQGKTAFEAMREPRHVPTPEAIDRMDEALHWLIWLDDDQRRIVFLRAFGMSYDRIGWRFRANGESIRRWYQAALAVVQRELRAVVPRRLSLPNLAQKA